MVSLENRQKALTSQFKIVYNEFHSRYLDFGFDEEQCTLGRTLLDGRKLVVMGKVLHSVGTPTCIQVECRTVGSGGISTPERYYLPLGTTLDELKKLLVRVITTTIPDKWVSATKSADQVYNLAMVSSLIYEANNDIYSAFSGSGVGDYLINIKNAKERKYNKRIESNRFDEMFNKYAKIMDRYPILAERETKDIVERMFTPVMGVFNLSLRYYQDLTFIDNDGNAQAIDFINKSGWVNIEVDNPTGEILVVNINGRWLVQYTLDDGLGYVGYNVNLLKALMSKMGVRYSENYGNQNLYKYWELYHITQAVYGDILMKRTKYSSRLKLDVYLDLAIEHGWVVTEKLPDGWKFRNGLSIRTICNDVANTNIAIVAGKEVTSLDDVVVTSLYNNDDKDAIVDELVRVNKLIGATMVEYKLVRSGEILGLKTKVSRDMKYYQVEITYRKHDEVKSFIVEHSVYNYNEDMTYFRRKVYNSILDTCVKWDKAFPTTELAQLYDNLLLEYNPRELNKVEA